MIALVWPGAVSIWGEGGRVCIGKAVRSSWGGTQDGENQGHRVLWRCPCRKESSYFLFVASHVWLTHSINTSLRIILKLAFPAVASNSAHWPLDQRNVFQPSHSRKWVGSGIIFFHDIQVLFEILEFQIPLGEIWAYSATRKVGTCWSQCKSPMKTLRTF